MSLPAPTVPSPGSETGYLAFEDGISSDGVSSPDEPVRRVPPAPHSPVRPFDGAKGVASAGLDLHSPTSAFVGTPFASGPTPLFEYPFPVTPPSLSNASSLSSIHGPLSPTTRLKHPFVRLSSKSTLHQPTRRRYSGGNNPPPIRVPPRLRTDSNSSVTSSVLDETTLAAVSAPGPSSDPSPFGTGSLAQRRDQSGSLGVLPLLTISVPSTGQPNDTGQPRASPRFVAGAAIPPALGAINPFPVRSPLRRTISERDAAESEERPSLEWRRASVPAIFGSRDGESDEALDILKTPTTYKSHAEDTAGDSGEVT